MRKPNLGKTIVLIWAAAVMDASAGMTVVTLTDMARARLDALSFFLVLYFLIAWVVKLAWNHLAAAFRTMPRLDYKRALGLVFVTGLLFYVVLTMISGARELLTPGAWEKQGTGYRQREKDAALSKEARQKALRALQNAIWAYAKTHGGNAPPSSLVSEMEVDVWLYPGGGMYCLMPGVRPGGGRDILVYEPSAAGTRRFVLLADGSMEDRAESTLKRQVEDQIRR